MTDSVILLYIHDISFRSFRANAIQVISMCEAYSKAGFKTILAIPSSNLREEQIYDIIKENIGIRITFHLHFYKQILRFNKINKYLNYYHVKKIVRCTNPDYILIRSPIFLIPAIKTGALVLYESHNSLLHNKIRFLDKYWKKVLLKATQQPNFIRLITISKALRDYWVNFGVREEIIITHHDGFNYIHYKSAIPKQEARKQLGLDQSKKLVLYSGSLYPDREIENVVKLAMTYDTVEFLVIGGPSENAIKLSNETKSLGINNITFLGPKKHKDIPIYLFSADVLLAIWSDKVPTINYCSPLKLFEYMAAGRTIVAHSFPTIQEVLIDNQNAILVIPNSFDKLKTKLEFAISKQCPPMLEKISRSHAFKYYTWDIRAEAIMQSIKN